MLQNSGRSGGGGFTLIEVLVMLLLVSLLAAAVFPVVTQRVSRVEPARAADHLGKLRMGIEAFAQDVEGAHAGDLRQLLSPVSSADAAIRRASQVQAFSAADSAGWRGPYLDVAEFAGGTLLTGFQVPIRREFTRFDSVHNAPAGSAGYQDGGSGLFVAVRVGSQGRQLTAAQFEAINDLVDGEAERDGPGANSSWTLGRLRFDNSLQPADSIAYYLAVPLDR